MSGASSVPNSALDASTSFCLVCSGVVRETWAWSLALSPQPSTSQFAVPFFTPLTEIIWKKSLVTLTAGSCQIIDGATNTAAGPIAFQSEMSYLAPEDHVLILSAQNLAYASERP